MDCALDYGDERQTELGRAVASSGLPRSELFITTKVPCCPKAHWDPIGRCQGGGGTSRAVPLNASLNPGCNPSCDQHGKQVGKCNASRD